MIERQFDIPFIANLALREKQIQQNYRPIIAVHKWFARRPGTLFRGLLLAEFAARPLSETFYEANDLHGLRVADPFMGGGTPLIEANRVGCDILGFDINPMSWWVVKQEIEHLDLRAYTQAAMELRQGLEGEIGHLYRTRCTSCGSPAAQVKYFLWVKTLPCAVCDQELSLFPGYLVAADARHPKNVFVCPRCGGLTETLDRKHPGSCVHCSAELRLQGPARRGRCLCHHCGHSNPFPNPEAGPPRHRLFAIEYHCPECKPTHKGRFFKAPDAEDLARVSQAEARWEDLDPRFVPNDEIPPGDETTRLHRWGYRKYSQMFNTRQRLGLELLARRIAATPDPRLRHALATNLSDLLRYQNMLCRYDTRALKSLDIFSVHGFPVGLVQCESNLLGIGGGESGPCIGSGGWANIVEKYRKAKAYCDAPFEVRHVGRRKTLVPIPGEWIGDRSESGEIRQVELLRKDAATAEVPPDSLDAVFTDPPYFGNVQYAELMDFCYVWLRRLVDGDAEPFSQSSTRNPEELTGNVEMGRDLMHFTEGLSRVFQGMSTALKPGRPLVFTYHHNRIEAYLPVAVAVLDSGLTCSATLPCPAEMGASIHISGTGSSIIDSVFVCRSTGTTRRKWLPGSASGLAELTASDLASLREGGVRPTLGDRRCIIHGHLVRLAIWALRSNWDITLPPEERIARVAEWIEDFGGVRAVETAMDALSQAAAEPDLAAIRETAGCYEGDSDEIPF